MQMLADHMYLSHFKTLDILEPSRREIIVMNISIHPYTLLEKQIKAFMLLEQSHSYHGRFQQLCFIYIHTWMF